MSDERSLHQQVDPPIPSVGVLQQTVEEHFPGLWPAVEAGLSVCATLLLEDNSNPVALIYEGGPSSVKTTVAEMLADHPQCYTSDNFTPASFVSHAANVAPNRLAQVDLLPRIKHKNLVTPELAPIFRGKEDELVNTFKIITRVLDGQGLQTDSGTHGRRGYRGDYLFAWIGATTPFEAKVWKVMAQLGSRLLFFRMDEREITVDELVESDDEMSYKERLGLCKQALHPFLTQLFEAYGGIRGVKWDAKQGPRPVREWIARMATLLAAMRSEPLREADPERQTPGFTPAKQEQPWRVHAVLRNFARGRALAYGRRTLSEEDLPLVAWVTVSSMPTECSRVFTALVQNGGEPLTVEQVQAALKVRHPETARSVMEDLDRRGVMEYVKEGQSGRLRFRPEWEWCASPEFQGLLVRDPIRNRGVCAAPVTSNLVQRQNEREERREKTEPHTSQKMTGGTESGTENGRLLPERLARTKAAVSVWLHQGHAGTTGEIAQAVKKRRADVGTVLEQLEAEGVVKVGTVRSGKGRPRREYYWAFGPDFGTPQSGQKVASDGPDTADEGIQEAPPASEDRTQSSSGRVSQPPPTTPTGWTPDDLTDSAEEIEEVRQSFRNILMPFGKHKGLRVKDLPTGYLTWLVEEDIVDRHISPDLAEGVEAELEARLGSRAVTRIKARVRRRGKTPYRRSSGRRRHE